MIENSESQRDIEYSAARRLSSHNQSLNTYELSRCIRVICQPSHCTTVAPWVCENALQCRADDNSRIMVEISSSDSKLENSVMTSFSLVQVTCVAHVTAVLASRVYKVKVSGLFTRVIVTGVTLSKSISFLSPIAVMNALHGSITCWCKIERFTGEIQVIQSSAYSTTRSISTGNTGKYWRTAVACARVNGMVGWGGGEWRGG